MLDLINQDQNMLGLSFDKLRAKLSLLLIIHYLVVSKYKLVNLDELP